MTGDYTDLWGSTNQDSGTPTINGTSDLSWFGSLSQTVTGIANVANAIKGPSANKSQTSIVTQKKLGGIDTKTWLYIGGGVLALVVLLFIVKRK